MQADDIDHDAGEQRQAGTWVALRDAATLMGVSVDTVKRRMQRGELQSRRETIPQGFRWLVRVEDPAPDQASLVVSEQGHPETQSLQVPAQDADVLTFLQGQLEKRNREIASLLATVASQARALEHAEERLLQLEASGSPESASDDANGSTVEAPAEPRTAPVWRRLWDAFRGS